jgi:hypothetical protein
MKPILYNTEMMIANLDGRKKRTSRPVRPQPRVSDKFIGDCTASTDKRRVGEYGFGKDDLSFDLTVRPQYNVGDILYARETFATDNDFATVFEEPVTHGFYYRADAIAAGMEWVADKCVVKWHPSIHMPRIAARFFQRVTGVRVQRLDDVTEQDAVDDGFVAKYTRDGDGKFEDVSEYELTALQQFVEFWKSTYGDDQWMWVYDIEHREKPEAQS